MITLAILLTLILVFVFILGTVIGSFLNVVILRAFSGESIVLPPSKCPNCGNKLKWWHNIPILSYIILKGKCGFCHEKISIQYPIIEFITGCLFVAVFCKYGLYPHTLFGFAVASILLVLTVTDIKKQIVFDSHTYFLIALGLIYNLLLTGFDVYDKIDSISGFHLTAQWAFSTPITEALLGLILGAIIMEIAARLGYLIAGSRAFGEGDTYIAAGLGAVFGWQNIILIIIAAVILQITFTLPIFIKKQFELRNWQAPISLLCFLLYAGIFFIAQHKNLIPTKMIYLICAIIPLLAFGTIAGYYTLKGIKNEENRTYLPFGPALAISGIILLLANNITFTI
jgi:leader peptidase (prepilin peptidase)/N-methyltransferase